MIGMDEKTGKLISGPSYIRQSIRRALRTQKGSMVMHPWFGTNHLQYLARNIDEALLLDITSEANESLNRAIRGIDGRVRVAEIREGKISFHVTLLADGKPYSFEDV